MATKVERRAASEIAEISRRLQAAKENGILGIFRKGDMATEVERRAASEVAEISRRLQAANENGILDMSGCGLMKMPDVVYLVLKMTVIQKCDLSKNQLQSVPSKLPVSFDQLQELILSENEITELPDELAGMSELKVLDLSKNGLTTVPPVVYQCGSLQLLMMNGNAIAEIDVDKLVKMQSLKEVDLKGNPLSPEGKSNLRKARINAIFDDDQ